MGEVYKGNGSNTSPIMVELTRTSPFEAEVIAARLAALGISATVGPDSPYPSVSFADGVPIFVSVSDLVRAKTVLLESDG